MDESKIPTPQSFYIDTKYQNIVLEFNHRQTNRIMLLALAVHEADAAKIQELSQTANPAPTLEEKTRFWSSIRDGTMQERELRWVPEHVAAQPIEKTSTSSLEGHSNALSYLIYVYQTKPESWSASRLSAIKHFGHKQVQYAEQLLLLEKNHIERVRKLEKHIKEGLQLIKMESYQEAQLHFGNDLDIGMNPGLGKVQKIPSLRSREEFDKMLYRIAGSSHPGELPCWYWQTPLDDIKPGDMPEIYNPELLQEFRKEVALICAEELIHELQHFMEIPTTDQPNSEVDVAAYLDREGFNLSDHFVTRYIARRNWFIAKYPEREVGITAFENNPWYCKPIS